MTRDYANHRNYRLRKLAQKVVSPEKELGSTIPSWAWMLLGLILGLFFSAIVLWKQSNSTHKKIQKPTPIIEQAKNNRFDFYRVLPSMKDEEVKTEKEEAVKINDYILQTGSFRKREQAEELKAKLAMLGYEGRVQTIKITPQEIWYRVYLGPFENKEKAILQQKKLQETHQIHSLVLKTK